MLLHKRSLLRRILYCFYMIGLIIDEFVFCDNLFLFSFLFFIIFVYFLIESLSLILNFFIFVCYDKADEVCPLVTFITLDMLR